MARFALHAIAPDRPGIVAAVSQALAEIGCNLEDSRMWRRHGQFSIVLVLEAPGVPNGLVVEEALAPLLEPLALQLFVRPVLESGDGHESAGSVTIGVVGADHPGTIARVARAIAAAGGNIVDLAGHVSSDELETPSRLELEALVPPSAVAELRAELDALAAELGMRCTLREGDTRAGLRS